MKWHKKAQNAELLEGSAAAMAVTAARTRKVYPVAWMSSRETLRAGFGRYRNRFLNSVIFNLFNGDNIFVTADHVQLGARRKLDSPGIGSKFLHFGF